MKLLFVFAVAAYLVIPHLQLSGAVLKDHVSDSSIFDGQPVLVQSYPTSFSRTVLAGAAASFIGDGNDLKTVGGIFATTGSDGSLNTGDIDSYRFRISFFDSVESYLSDPYGESLLAPSKLVTLSAPSNTDYLVPVGTSDQGHDYLYWEFDIESQGLKTTAGKSQLVMIHPVGLVFSGLTYMAFSEGGSSAIGEQSDYFRSDILDLGPDKLSELGAPTPFAAYYVETVVPEPSSAALGWLSLIGYASKSRRSKR